MHMEVDCIRIISMSDQIHVLCHISVISILGIYKFGKVDDVGAFWKSSQGYDQIWQRTTGLKSLSQRYQVASLNIVLLEIIQITPLLLEYPLVDMIHSFATAHLASLSFGFYAFIFCSLHFPRLPPLTQFGLLHSMIGIFSHAFWLLSLKRVKFQNFFC